MNEVPEELYLKIKQKIGDKSLSEYLLELVEKDLEEHYSREDEAKVKARLRQLGYVD